MAEVTLENFPFSFIDSQSSLQSIASTELAFDIWKYKYFNHFNRSPDPDDDEFSFLKETFKCDKMLSRPAPPLIKNIINKKIELVGAQMTEWKNFYEEAQLFDSRFHDVFPTCLRCIVLRPNGEINHKKTASNLVLSGEFNDVEKYKLACFFCLEDDVKRIWPLVSNNVRVIGAMVMRGNFMYHWNRKMISRSDPLSAVSRFLKAAEGKCVANCVASEYFFDMLRCDKKILRAKCIIGADKFSDRLKLRLLRRLDMNQAQGVFRTHGWKILSILIKHDEYICWLYDVWVHMKDAVLENPRQFLEITRKLWMMVVNEAELNFEARKSINYVLIDMWASAPDDLKSHIANNRIGKFFSRLCAFWRGFSDIYGHDMTFMFQLFDRAEYETRNQIWKKNWRKLAVRAKPYQLQRFMKSSLPDDQSIETFKRDSLIKPSMLYSLFIKEGLYSDFANYLRFVYKDRKFILNQSKQALMLNVHLILNSDSYKLNKFETFVSEIFSNNDIKVTQFKEQMILTTRALICLNATFETSLPETFIQIVNSFVSSDQTLNKLKHAFFKFHINRMGNIPSMLTSYHLEKWWELVEWCFDDEIKAKLKKTFEADKIMIRMVNGMKMDYEMRSYLQVPDIPCEMFYRRQTSNLPPEWR